MHRRFSVGTILSAVLLAVLFLPGVIGQRQTAHAQMVIHPTGLRLSTHHAKVLDITKRFRAAVLPDAADLSQFDPPQGDQKQVGSCVSWAATYYYLDWLLNRSTHTITDGFAPMYTYAQVNGGVDEGSSFEDTLGVLQSQGATPGDQYSLGLNKAHYDWQDQPSQADHQKAAPYKISGWNAIYYQGQGSTDPVASIKSAIASGTPVLLALPVYANFMFAGQGYPILIGNQQGQLYGYHAVFADGYDKNGLKFFNSWGPSWGQNGRAELSWSGFIKTLLVAAYTIDLPPLPQPVPTNTPLPVPTNTPAPFPTNTPLPVPTNTPVPQPTNTPAPSPTPAPVSFPKTRWGAYTTAHSLKAIPYLRSTGELKAIAGFWARHMSGGKHIYSTLGAPTAPVEVISSSSGGSTLRLQDFQGGSLLRLGTDPVQVSYHGWEG